MRGRVMIVTGGSAGIGAAAAREFAARGADVVLTGRSAATLTLAAEIGAQGHLVDFADFDQVRGFAQTMLARHDRIDLLANNVGGIQAARQITRDGHEVTLQVNHLSGFLLTELLRGRILASGGLVVNTASMANTMARLDLDDVEHAKSYSAMAAYADAKLMNILHAQELARRVPGLAVASFHPGVIASEFARSGSWLVRALYAPPLSRLFMKSPQAGADTLIWLAGSTPGKDWQSGGYFDRRRPGRVNPRATPEAGARLWDISARAVGLAG